jgi:hypothetical protein
MTTSTIPVPRRHARLGRYALWQAGDFAMNVGIISVILFALLGVVTWMNLHAMEEFYIARRQPFPLGTKLIVFKDAFAAFVMVAPIISLSGIVSQDRTLGYTRFFFSKPVSPRVYYAQSFLVRLLGYLVVGHVLVLTWAYFELPGYTVRFVGDMVLGFVAVGGIVFLISVVSRFDGLVAIVALLLAEIFWSKWETVTGIKHWLTYLLPPVNHIGDLHAWLVGVDAMASVVPIPFPTKWALWNAGYGLACLALGLYLLRRIPLTKA